MQIKLAKELNELYVEYVNDFHHNNDDFFLTVECFARYKGFRLDFAKAVIKSGRKINSDQNLLNTIYS